jgi:hypothetical protein
MRKIPAQKPDQEDGSDDSCGSPILGGGVGVGHGLWHGASFVFGLKFWFRKTVQNSLYKRESVFFPTMWYNFKKIDLS